MPELTLTPGDVIPSADATLLHYFKAYVALTPGSVVFLRSDNTWQFVDCTSGSLGAPVGTIVGIVVNEASPGQYVTVDVEDTALQLGAALDIGELYYAGPNGGLMPYGDLAPTDYRIYLGAATDGTTLVLKPRPSGTTA